MLNQKKINRIEYSVHNVRDLVKVLLSFAHNNSNAKEMSCITTMLEHISWEVETIRKQFLNK